MTPEEIDRVGQGRVWSGEDAFSFGLVDRLGGLEDAIASAAQMADLGEEFAVKYIEKELDFKQKVLAAHRAGLTDVVVPRRNEIDIDDVPEKVREDIVFHIVDTVDDVLKTALS